MGMKINTWLTEAAIKTPHKKALITKNSSYSYRWIDKMSNIFANDLINKYQAKPNDRIALVLSNDIQFIVAYYSILKVGAVCVPIHHLLKDQEIDHILNHSESNLLISDLSLFSSYSKWNDFQFSTHSVVSGYSNDDNELIKPLFIFKIKTNYTPNRQSEDEDAVIFYTSGTSGTPKGVILTHENVLSKMNPIKQAIKFSSEDKLLTGLPLVYVYGQIMALNFVVWCNASLILLEEDEKEQDLIWGLKKQGATVMMSTPTTYYRLNHFLKQMGKRITHNLRYGITGGSSSSIKLKKEFEKYFNVQLLDSYGLTETSASIIMEYTDVHHRKQGSIGRALSNHHIQILDEYGVVLPPGQIGEIAVAAQSKSVMKGYVKEEIAQNRSIVKGWFLTGDLGYQDISGNFFIVDRRNDIIQTLGFVVSPREIEEVLLEHPSIQETAVVGIPDEEKGEVIKAFITINQGFYLSQQEINNFLVSRLAKFKLPEIFEFVDELPRTNSGKLLKRLLR